MTPPYLPPVCTPPRRDGIVGSFPSMDALQQVAASPRWSHPRVSVTEITSPQTPAGLATPGCPYSHWCEEELAPNTEFLELARLSLPIIVTYVLELLPGVVSVSLVGRMESPLTKEYVDGAALSNMFMNLSGVAVGFGLATAMDTLCSQTFGAGKPKQMGIYLQSGLLVMAVAMVPVFLANWFTEDLLLLMGQHKEVSRLAGRFSRLSLPGLPFLFAYELLKKVFQAQNIVKPMMYIAVWSNLVNLALGAYLTWYTPLGFDGAAIARSIASLALLAGVFPYLMLRPMMLHQWWGGWAMRTALRHTRTFLTLGIPGMFMIMLEWWSYEAIAIVVGLLPDSVVALSVHSVIVNVSNVTFNFFMGIAVATSIRAGNYVGSDQPLRARLVSRLGLLLSLLVALALGLVIVVSRHALPSVFINDATSTALAANALLFLLPFQLVDACNCVMQGIFRGTGRQTFAAVVNLFAYYAVGLPAGIVLALPLHLGVKGCWIGFTGGVACALAASLVKMRHTNWYDLADAAKERTTMESEADSRV
jgi:multidrug resistance protein, MATE family